MLIPILIAIVVVVVLFVVIVATRPSEFRITRKATMSAPASAIFAQVNDFHNWDVWSPWAKLDPNMKHTFEGPASGVGASHSWSGNNKVGEGNATITESQPHDRIVIRLEFLRPFTATNTAEFLFQPTGNQTAVTWNMYGTNNFMGKAFGMIMNMDKMVGRDFEKGLASMKTLVETG